MTYFITIDSTNQITGLYSDDVDYQKPPKGSIKLKTADSNKLLNGFTNWTYVSGSLVDNNDVLRDKRNYVKGIVKDNFILSSNNPIFINDIAYQGNIDSIIKLDAIKRLSELLLDPNVIFYDANNKPNTLTIDAATNIIKTLSGIYQDKFKNKQALMVQIDIATSEAELDTILASLI